MAPGHPATEEWVRALLGESPPGEAARLREHAAACPGCRERRDSLPGELSRLTALARKAAIPPGTPRLSAGSAPWPRGIGWIRGLPLRAWAPRAAAALLAVAGAWFLLRGGPPSAPAGRVAWVRSPGAGIGRLRAGDAVRGGTDIRSPKGFRIGIELSSGAFVTWNGETGARVESGKEIMLSSGELHVRVPKGAEGFAVTTPHGRVVDLGTAFLVRADARGTEVRVVKGSVRAEAPAGGRNLKEGERESLGDLAPSPFPPAEADRALGWVREAVFPARFDDAPLPEVLDLLESVSPFRFEYDRERAMDVHVIASLGGASSEAIVEGLRAALPGRSVREGWNVTLELVNRRP